MNLSPLVQRIGHWISTSAQRIGHWISYILAIHKRPDFDFAIIYICCSINCFLIALLRGSKTSQVICQTTRKCYLLPRRWAERKERDLYRKSWAGASHYQSRLSRG